MIPRNSHSATNITTSSDVLADPALVMLANEDAHARANETSDEALARIVAALERYRPPWHTDPARGCAGMAPATFISKRKDDRAEAFQACGRCPDDIRKACARWAIEVGETQAIAGGMDPQARKPLVREYQRQLAEQRAAQDAAEQADDMDDDQW